MFYNPDNVIGYGVPDFDLALKLTGKHPSFDYTKRQVINFNKTKYEHEESVSIYAPDYVKGFCAVKQQKRFLFFKYFKTRSKTECTLDPIGFGRMQVLLYNIPNGKKVTLSFYAENQAGEKTVVKELQGELND